MKITVTINGGKEVQMEVQSYNAIELTEAMNDQQITMVNIGDTILNKHSITMISPTVAPAV